MVALCLSRGSHTYWEFVEVIDSSQRCYCIACLEGV